MARSSPSEIPKETPSSAVWEPSEHDQRAELEHTDGRRRPWRAAALGLVALAAAAVVMPNPWSPLSLLLSALFSLAAGGVGWQFPLVRMLRQRGLSTALTVDNDPPGLTIEQGGVMRRLSPAAVKRLVIGADHVFLHLDQAEVLTIPCRVFDRRGSLDRFVERIDRFRRRGIDPTRRDPPDRPEPGREVWSFVYHLPSRGVFAAGSARNSALHQVIIAGLTVASLITLLSSSLRSFHALWHTSQELLLVAMFAGVGGLFAAISGRSRAPRGRVTLSVGPEGGWMHTEEGSSRFEWSRVLGVELSPGLVVLRFVDRVVPVPSSAFVDEDARQRFARQTRLWCRQARTSKAPAKQTRPLLSGRDPFAPPRAE